MTPPENPTKATRKESNRFESGMFKLAERNKLKLKSKEYMNAIVGKVDSVSIKRSMVSTAPKINENFTKPAKLLLALYKKRPWIFTPETARMIGSNEGIITSILKRNPKNLKQFEADDRLQYQTSVYGAKGILNILLAFNRIRSKLKPSVFKALLQNPRMEPLFKFSLQTNATREVEVTFYEPTIKEPDISRIKINLDYPVKITKRVRKNGVISVFYSSNAPGYKSRKVFTLHIDPKRKMVNVIKHSQTSGGGTASLNVGSFTFKQFDAKAKKDAYFLHKL